MQAGISMADRSFECVLCQKKFTRFTPDAILLSEDLVCDACLEELHSLDEGELRRQISVRLAGNPTRHSQDLEQAVARLIQQYGKA